jgi:hypothetical protein
VCVRSRTGCILVAQLQRREVGVEGAGGRRVEDQAVNSKSGIRLDRTLAGKVVT